MEKFQEQIYAGINEYSNTSVYTGHRIRDVRLDYAYGMTFDGHQTVYLSLYFSRSILALDIYTDEVKVAVQSSSIQPYKLYFDAVTSSLVMISYDSTYRRLNLGKWNLVTRELSFLLPRTSVNRSTTTFNLEIRNDWHTGAVHIDDSVWMVGHDDR